jgi:putative ABC transport system permease protein
MLKYYLLLFARNLKRQKLFSFINLLGLTVSMVSTLLIYLYVSHEFSYDRFHSQADRIYRVNQTFIWGENNDNQFASTGPGVAYAVKEELPEVELVTSIHTPGNFIISYTNESGEVKSFEEERILAADTNFFKMFNFPLVKGDIKKCIDTGTNAGDE